MFDMSWIDLLVLIPVLGPLVLGVVLEKIEGASNVRKVFRVGLGLSFFAILLLSLTVLGERFSKFSIIVFQGLFSIDKTLVSLALIANILAMGVYLLNSRFGKDGVRSIDLFLFLSLCNALIFSHNLIFVFVLSELLFLKAAFPHKGKMSLLDLQGAQIRLLAIIFLLGSIAISFGPGNALTINFLKTNAATLYAADHLFAIGAVLTLAGLFEVVWLFIKDAGKVVDYQKIFGFFTILVFIFKYSSANLFMVLEEAQDLIQWLLVLGVLYKTLEMGKVKTLEMFIHSVYSVALLTSLSFLLPLIFDGEGNLEKPFVYATVALLSVLVAVFLEQAIREKKGERVLTSEVSFVKKHLPQHFFVIGVSMAAAAFFPIGTSFYVLLTGLKLSLASGFYWSTAWVLVGASIAWISLLRLLFQRSDEPTDNMGFLWKDQAFQDLNFSTAVGLTFMIFILPLAAVRLFAI